MSKIEVNQISSQCGSTLTIGQSGDTVTLACGASQTGFGRTGTVDWDTTAKTANFTATSGDGFFCNTTSGVFTATLPAGSAGAIVSFADYAATWQTNNLTVSPNGTDKIGGVNADVILNTEGQSVTFVYVDDTQGWINTMDSTSNVRANAFIEATGGTITTCGDFKIHAFTGPGTFTVTNAGAGTPTAPNSVDYLVVAGGGGGGWDTAGGGGAGGFRESSGAASGCYTASPLGACVAALPVSVTAYPITVGGGGTAGLPGSFNGGKGANSVFSTITSTGGGGGGSCGPAPGNGGDGGSGGGGGRNGGSLGPGNTPPVSPPQGNNGGAGFPGGTGSAGGGGGATAVGQNGGPDSSPSVSNGGAGAGTLINPATGESGPGPSRYYSGGGGGGMRSTGSAPQPQGGIGGGGDGNSASPTPNNTAGTANTGGGGGGGGSTAKAGGSGIVIIRYKFQ